MNEPPNALTISATLWLLLKWERDAHCPTARTVNIAQQGFSPHYVDCRVAASPGRCVVATKPGDQGAQ